MSSRNAKKYDPNNPLDNIIIPQSKNAGIKKGHKQQELVASSLNDYDNNTQSKIDELADQSLLSRPMSTPETESNNQKTLMLESRTNNQIQMKLFLQIEHCL
ncbi:36762_t:CDS:2 [Gigaspora margarita]|uniref:36762_t:CDS:1 n=1 Tax=Gigaspora margarita TaxID=4874 RepID=A0ABN7W3I7_GIGMA|nr:36762_t:CDS:2 [Gigaspora margarita]